MIVLIQTYHALAEINNMNPSVPNSCSCLTWLRHTCINFIHKRRYMWLTPRIYIQIWYHRMTSQFSSVTQSRPTTLGHQLLELAQTHVHWVSDASNHLVLCHPFLLLLQSFPASGSFPSGWVFASGGQSIGASASAAVFPINIQDLFLLGYTGLISL